MGMKFSTDSSVPNFTQRCNDKVYDPKLKILLKFYQISEYKRSAGVYPLRDFDEICRVCTSFQDTLAVKIWIYLPAALRAAQRAAI